MTGSNQGRFRLSVVLKGIAEATIRTAELNHDPVLTDRRGSLAELIIEKLNNLRLTTG